MKHRTVLSYRKNWKSKPEVNSGKSETIPDQVLPIKELLRRHTAEDLKGSMTLIYDEDGDMPDPRTLDLVDVENMKNANKKFIDETTDNLRHAKRPRRKNKASAEPKNENEPPALNKEEYSSKPTQSDQEDV